MRQPPNVRVRVEPEEPIVTSDGVRVDRQGHIVLSDKDVQRIAALVADLLRQPQASAEPATGDDYISVRRNKPDRPMSEY